MTIDDITNNTDILNVIVIEEINIQFCGDDINMFATIQAVETRVSDSNYYDDTYSITLSGNCSKYNVSCTEFCEIIKINERDYDTTEVNFLFWSIYQT